MRTWLLLAAIGCASIAGAEGPTYLDDASDRDQPYQQASPAQKARARAWVAGHPDAAAAPGAGARPDPQAIMSDELDHELDKLTPRQRQEMGSDLQLAPK